MRAPEANPKRGGKAIFAFSVTTNHFDIHQAGGPAKILWHTYSNLVRLDPTDGLKSSSRTWPRATNIGSGSKVYTFKLRPGVKWHDGTDFTADDILATFDRISSHRRAWSQRLKPRFGAIQNVEAPDKIDRQ